MINIYKLKIFFHNKNSSKMTIDEETFEALRQIHSQLKLDEEVGWAGAGRY